MKIAAFSDIHYASYSTGVTIEDCARSERAFTEYCKEKQVDFAVFCGDRYLAHLPDDESRIASDLEQRYRNDAGIVTFSLVGNHDVWAKAMTSGHSNRHVRDVWGDVLSNVVVMDELRTYRHERVPGVALHAIPAGIEWPAGLGDLFDIRIGELNICVFHDMLAGCILDHSTAYKSPKGKKIDAIDDSRFDLVLGGDIHISQRLPFKNTRGGYVGATIQQSRRDRGNARGWLYVDTSDERMRFEESPAPRFVEVKWDLSTVEGRLPTIAEIEKIVADTYDDRCEGNILDVLLQGTREQLDAVPKGWNVTLREQLRARRVNSPIKQPIGVALLKAATINSGRKASALEDLEQFLRSGRAKMDGYDMGRLLEKAAPVLRKIGG